MDMDMCEENIIGPMNILPSQYYPISTAAYLPERRLMLAVLQDAVEMYLKNKGIASSRRANRICREEEEWFQSTDATWLYSFENICCVLDLDAEGIRKALFRDDSTCRRPEIRLTTFVRKIS